MERFVAVRFGNLSSIDEGMFEFTYLFPENHEIITEIRDSVSKWTISLDGSDDGDDAFTDKKRISLNNDFQQGKYDEFKTTAKLFDLIKRKDVVDFLEMYCVDW